MAKNPPDGLFLASYEITTGLAGAPTFNVQLVVYPPNKSVKGFGQITQTTNPPLDLHTSLHGDFSYMTVMPDKTTILLVATGWPIVHWSPCFGPGPVIPPNASLRMVLKDDWKSGTANFGYADANGEWQTVDGAKVKSVPSATL